MADLIPTLTSPSIINWHLRDLAYRFLPKPLSALLYITSNIAALLKNETLAYDLLMRAHRYNPSDFLSKRIKQNLHKILAKIPELTEPPVDIIEAAGRSIVLKLPIIKGSEIEKGILLITFTNTFRYYYHHIDIDLLSKYFSIVLEPSWAGYCLPEILFWCDLSAPVIVESTEVTDRKFLDILDTNLKYVDFGASDWVDYRIFRPLDLPKKYDVIYVANYSPIKRVHIFFRALKKIKHTDKNYRAALLCASWGEHRSTVMRLIKAYGINDMLHLHEDANFEQVNELLNQSKVNILLSLKEGSNRSLFESMFAGTPVIALKNNVGINQSYINKQTGKLVNERALARTLLQLKHEYKNYDTRAWAETHISPEATTKKLLAALNNLEAKKPQSSSEVYIKVNNPEVSYISQSLTLSDNEKRTVFNCSLLNLFSNNKRSNREEIIDFLQKNKIE